MDHPEIDRVLCPDLLVYVGRVEGADDVDVIGALAKTGVQVRRARTAEEAAALVRFLPVRLLVVGLDGHEDVWRLIRRTASSERSIPVACLSARATRSRVLGAVRRGARSYLVGPIDADAVTASLTPLLNGHAPPQDEPSITPQGSLEELAR